MSQEESGIVARKYINKDKWWDILSKIIDVLRINIFIVDSTGGLILPSEEGKYGGRFFTDSSLKFDFLQGSVDINSFDMFGIYLEKSNRYGLNTFAVPLKIDKLSVVVAYLVIGPVIINKKAESRNYETMAKAYNVDSSSLLNEINGVRVVSNIMMKSILDLLYDIAENNIKLSIEEEKLADHSSVFNKEMSNAEKEIYSTINFDELLVSFLDVALKLTETECGSIMVLDESSSDLTIRASRGLDEKKTQNTRVRVGEGISGIAAKNKESFVINSGFRDNRINSLLKRPDISESVVMPLIAKDKVFGVLNLYTKKEKNRISENFDKLQYLSELLSSAI